MMWPRLQLLRELLAEDGAIFVSIDDNEVHRLRGMMDEIFGEDRFVCVFIWKRRKNPDSRTKIGVSVDHEYCLVYRKTESVALLGQSIDLEKYQNPNRDPRGPWASDNLVGLATKEQRPNLHYKLVNPETVVSYACPPTGWRYSRETMAKLIADSRIIWPAEADGRPRYRRYLSDLKDHFTGISSILQTAINADGTIELTNVFEGKEAFDFPKPRAYVQLLIEQLMESRPTGTVLDSFAGSGTTAHAVLALNKKDGGHRKFILVETEEYADQLTAERVRRVIHGYKFAGTQREELLREPLNWTKLQKAAALVEKAESIAQFEGTRFDKVTKSVEDGALVVTGEKKVTEKTEGLGGSFTFCTLGEEMTMEKLLGSGLPTYEALAKYVFFTATGRTLQDVAQSSTLPYRGFAIREPSEPSSAPASSDALPSATRRHGRLKICATGDDTGFVGETDLYRVHLLSRADKKWLAGNDAALNEALVTRICATNSAKKRVLVFASAKFMSQRELTRLGVDFCQLPYTIHRILGE